MADKIYEKHKKLYQIVISIRQRCYNINSHKYSSYGNRGIIMCDEWRDNNLAFISWALANGYKDGLSIDRIDNDGNYEPSNCRWVGRNTQSRNTRAIYSTNTSGYRGVTICGGNKYKAQIRVNGLRIYIGSYAAKEDAAIAYDKYVIENKLEHTTNGLYTKDN